MGKKRYPILVYFNYIKIIEQIFTHLMIGLCSSYPGSYQVKKEKEKKESSYALFFYPSLGWLIDVDYNFPVYKHVLLKGWS